jgi:hypothetical protein
MSLPYDYTAGYMSARDSANVGDIDKLITGALFEIVFQGFSDNDNALILKDGGVWENNLSSENGALSLTYGSITLGAGDITLATGDITLTAGGITLPAGDITLTNGTINAKIDGGTF